VNLDEAIDQVAAQTRFSGVVRVDRGNDVVLERAYGYAHRAHQIPNRVTSQLALASGAKAFTALAVVGLIEDGVLDRNTTARSLLGDDLPLVHDDVTVEHLLTHRSGIGDYLDEDTLDDVNAYVMPVPVHELADTEQYVAILGGHPAKFAPGERFSYCNGGYVLLALLAERASGVEFHELVRQRVCVPAGMTDTDYLRSDELPARAALGYLSTEDGARTNVLHVPVRGGGDGGIYSTVADIRALWCSFFAGQIVSPPWVDEMVRDHRDDPASPNHYGLGLWLHATRPVAMLEGYDAGASFRSGHDPHERLTYTVISNTTEGAWPITRCLESHLGL
jgi:CubicO group peptidase (beta-lactamase class C family)